MTYGPDLLDHIQGLDTQAWSGSVFRHMLGNYPPSLENTRGARWNPPGTSAIYTSLSRDGAIAEANYRLSLEPFRPRLERVVYEMSFSLDEVLDLTSPAQLQVLGIDSETLQQDDYTRCQMVGGAVEWLGHDGMFVPSARSTATNLVVFSTNLNPGSDFTILSREVLEA